MYRSVSRNDWPMTLRMLAIGKWFLLAGCAMLAMSPLSRAAPAVGPDVPVEAPAQGGRILDAADLEAWLDGFVPYALKSGDIAGAVVIVVKDGRVLLQKGFGFADVSRKVRMDPARTLVRIGSTSKLFTWTAVMQLVERGKLDLDRNVNDYLDFKIPEAFGKQVTLRDLMNHRAGFEEGLKDILRIDPNGLPSTEAYLKEHPRPRLFAPGTVPAYSNYGAALAGYIVERVSGEKYERYIERHILVPLGMDHSSFDQPLPERFVADVSKGYLTASEPPGSYELVVPRPAGSGTTTAADMAHFMLAHLQQGRYGDAQLLEPATVEQMHAPSQPAMPGFATMAHGFFRETRNGRLVIGHGGDTNFFHNELNLLPEEGVGILFNFNSRGQNSAVDSIRYALFDGFMDRYFPDPAAGKATRSLPSAMADAQQIAGRYESSRRNEHGFVSFFYLLNQTVIDANPDGTIVAPAFSDSNPVTLQEIAPQEWQQLEGSRRLSLQTIGGVKTVIDSADPSSVLQAVPMWRSSALNLPVLLGSVFILVLTLLGWLLAPLCRPAPSIGVDADAAFQRARLWIRSAAAFQVLYLGAWVLMLRPLVRLQLEFYAASADNAVRALQVAGLLAIVAAAVAVWNAWRLSRMPVSTWVKGAASLVAASTLGVVWIAAVGGLLGFSLNY